MLVNPHAVVWDEESYHSIASAMAGGADPGPLFWPPGWLATIAVLYRLFGANPTVVMLFNTVISVFSLILVGLIAYRMFGRSAAYIGVWIAALTPSYILANGIIMYEVWLQFLLLLATYWSLRQPWGWSQTIVTALIACLCGLIRSFWICLPALMWVVNWLFFQKRPAVRLMLLAQVTTLTLISPWVIYSSHRAGRFVPVAMNSGMNLWIGNNPSATGTYVPPPDEFWLPEFDNIARDQAIQFLKNYPLQAIGLIPNKVWFLFNQEHPVNILFARTKYEVEPMWPTIARIALDVTYWLTNFLAAVCIIRLIYLRQWALLAPTLVLLFNVAAHLPFFGVPRFNWPVRYITILYVSAVVAHFLSSLSQCSGIFHLLSSLRRCRIGNSTSRHL